MGPQDDSQATLWAYKPRRLAPMAKTPYPSRFGFPVQVQHVGVVFTLLQKRSGVLSLMPLILTPQEKAQ